jgi:hypothetical protein
MDTIATKECARMMCRGMPYLGIRITPPPGQDGSAIDNEVTGTNETTAEGDLHRQDQQRLPDWGTSSLLPFPLLGSRRDTWLTTSVKGQPARER